MVDPQRSLVALQGKFPGITIDVSGAGDHLPKVDAKIRRVKELYRSVKAGLPYELPKARARDLMTYSVSRINVRRTSAHNNNICPRVRFTGKKIMFKREFQCGFGDYVEAYDPKVRSNTSQNVPNPASPCS